MSADPLFVGLDIGTSGARAVVIDAHGRSVATAKATMAEHGPPRAPTTWRRAAEAALRGAFARVDARRIAALSVDGTSGTLIGLDAKGEPIGDALMYNDASRDSVLIDRIAKAAPATSGAHGPTSGLAKAFELRALGAERIAHQADWIASQFSGRIVSDANNALKTGYDPEAERWPGWIEAVGFDIRILPDVLEPGEVVGTITAEAAAAFGLHPQARVVAGSTDGCASFLATGARAPGEGVTALGTTLTIKLLSERAIFAPKFGVYSHRIFGLWLAGGASNSGGGALLAHFSADEIAALTPQLRPEAPTGLDYYPLPKPGERFPIADPDFEPRLTPRPRDRAQFLQALLEGVAGVEALAYRRLAELGAPKLVSVRSVGGGGRNDAWTRIRAARLAAPMLPAAEDEAAYGAALIAMRSA